MSVIDFLGYLGAVCLIAFYIPQLYSIWRAPRLEGFNLFAWCILGVAVASLATQLALLQVWSGVTANVIAIGAVLFTVVAILRKGT